MATFKSFSELKQAHDNFKQAQIEARIQDEVSSSWRWFERNIRYKEDAALPLRRVNSHGRKGVFKTLAPPRRRVQRISLGGALS